MKKILELFWKGKLPKRADQDMVDCLCKKITTRQLYKKLRTYIQKI